MAKKTNGNGVVVKQSHESKLVMGMNVSDMTVHDGLLLAIDFDSRKAEIYETVATEMHALFPYRVVEEAGKFSVKYPDEFPGVIGYLTMQFTEYPTEEVEKDGKKEQAVIGFTRLGKMITEQKKNEKDHKLSNDQIRAWTAINRFSVWYNGYKLQILREASDRKFQAQVEEREKQLVAELPKEAKKDKNIMEKVHNSAVKAIRAAGRIVNPRVLDGKGNINIPQIKNMPSDKQSGIVIEMAKLNTDMVVEALKAAGRPVVAAKSIDELRAATLLEKLSTKISSGEFSNPGEAKKHIEALQKLLAVNGMPEVAKKRGRKAVNA